jgi:glutathione S-transferase
MKLYYSPGACSLAVHIVAREADIAIDLVKVDLLKHQLDDGSDYFAINARGYVPLLELDDGSRHSEAGALLQYLGDLSGNAALLPKAGTPERFEVVKWVTFVGTELHKTFSPWLWHKETADSTIKAVKDKLAARFSELDKLLATRAYLTGEHFTIADAYAFAIVNWTNFLGISLKAYPSLAAYLERVALRPKVREALVAEGLVKA